jgi:ubiquinone biosynthesis protein UbiJ/gas vesicle protein
MNKKLFKGLLAVSLTLGTACSFTSCKDTDEDIYARIEQELNDKNASLEQQLQAQANVLEQLKKELSDQIETYKCTCKDKWDALETTKQELAQALQDIAELKQTDAALEQKVEDLKNKLNQQATDFANTYATLEALNQTKADLEDEIKTVRDTAADLEQRVIALETALGTVTGRLDGIDGRLEGVDGSIAAINSFLTDEMKTNITTALAAMPGLIESLGNLQTDTAQALADAAQAIQDAAAAQADATSALNWINAFEASYSDDLSNLNQTITNNYNTLDSKINDALEDIETNAEAISTLSEAFTTAQEEIAETLSELTLKFENYYTIAEIDQKVSDLTNNFTTLLNDKVSKADLETLVREILSEDLAKITANEQAIAKLDGDLDDLSDYVDELADRLQALEDAGFATTDDLEGVKTALTDLIDKNAADIATLNSTVTDLRTDLDALTAKVEKLAGKIDAISNKVNSMITSIVVQNVSSRLFGSISTPFGVNTNVLLAYYGDVAHPIEFPYGGSQYEYNGQRVLTGAEIGALGTEVFTAPSGIIVDDREGNAGKVYVTVNPSSVDATGASFKLVNSKDAESGIELSPLVASDTELKFGYTRGANNGFYVAQATLPADRAAINKVKINIDSNLKSAMSSVLKTKSRSNVTNLLVQLFRQFEGTLSAQGLKAPWSYTDENGKEVTAATYSNYGIAATAFQPLSFKFLYDTSLPNLPTINTINQIEFDTPSFDFDIKPINISTPEINLTLNLQKISISIKEDYFKVTVADFPIGIDQNTGELITEERTFYVGNAEGFADDLNQQINDAIDSWPAQISDSVKDAINDALADVTDSISSQIDDMLDDISGQISDKVSDIITDIEDEVNGYISSVDNYIDRVNNVIGRLNNVLTSPNHYLQVMIAYKGSNGNFYQLSNSKKNPSIFKHNGGTGINLIATTYTAEVVAPAYKKFIAVTNVYNADGTTNETLKKQANASASFNEVLNGIQRRVALNIPTSATGCTYEIVYSALDYHGVTSTQKFYLKVK